MKKITDTSFQSLSIKYVKLYMDELDEINNIFSGCSSEYEIRSHGYSYENYDEFIEDNKNKDLTSLSFNSTNLHVGFALDEKGIFITASGNNTDSVAAFHQIKDICHKSINKVRKYLNPHVVSFFIALFFSFLLLYLSKDTNLELSDAAFGFLIGGLFIVVDLVLEKIYYVNTFLRVMRRVDETNIFLRNREKIIFHIINSIISAVVGGFVMSIWKP